MFQVSEFMIQGAGCESQCLRFRVSEAHHSDHTLEHEAALHGLGLCLKQYFYPYLKLFAP